jgi:hypothetical protein
MEGSWHGLFGILSRQFLEGLREIAKHLRITVSRLRFEPSNPRIRVQSVVATSNRLVNSFLGLWKITKTLIEMFATKETRDEHNQNTNHLHVCMYVCTRGGPEIRPLHRDHQWFIVLPLLINPLLILHFEWSVGLYLRGVIIVTWLHKKLAQVTKS